MGIFGDRCAAFPEVARFQVIYDGHQPEYPGDFTSVEQTVDEVTAYLKTMVLSIWTRPTAVRWAARV